MVDIIIRAQATYMLMVMATQIRNGLMTHIYEKIIRLAPSARKDFSGKFHKVLNLHL